ncbi:MAG: hypothetical protein WCJ29_02550 [bacterium]
MKKVCAVLLVLVAGGCDPFTAAAPEKPRFQIVEEMLVAGSNGNPMNHVLIMKDLVRGGCYFGNVVHGRVLIGESVSCEF